MNRPAADSRWPGAHDVDVLVVGGGPAGLQAALTLGRCLRRVVVVDAAHPRNGCSGAVHAFLTRDGTPPMALLAVARDQLAPYGVPVERGVVVGVERDGERFAALLADGRVVRCRHLLLTTGITDRIPEVEGLRDRVGTSAFPCPYCDAWEHRGRRLAIIADGDEAAGFAITLAHWSRDVLLLPVREPPGREGRARLERQGIALVEDRVLAVEGPDLCIERLVLASGRAIERDVVFFKGGCGTTSELPIHLGCELDDDGLVRADADGATNVPGVWAAGDLTAGPKMVIVAAAEGARAGMAMHKAMAEVEEARGSVGGGGTECVDRHRTTAAPGGG
jgi:thioredoxin reductase